MVPESLEGDDLYSTFLPPRESVGCAIQSDYFTSSQISGKSEITSEKMDLKMINSVGLMGGVQRWIFGTSMG